MKSGSDVSLLHFSDLLLFSILHSDSSPSVRSSARPLVRSSARPLVIKNEKALRHGVCTVFFKNSRFEVSSNERVNEFLRTNERVNGLLRTN